MLIIKGYNDISNIIGGLTMEENLILNKLRDDYKENIETFYNLKKFMKVYNPWTDKEIEKLSEDFIGALENGNDFSWLQVDKDLYDDLKKSKGKDLSIDYGIPSHIRGDIDKGTLFLCLVNPNIDTRVAMSEALNARKAKENLNLKDYIKDYIINTDSKGGIFYMELENLLSNKDEDPGYYLREYFNLILSAYSKNKDVKSKINSVDKLCKILKDEKLRKKFQKEIQDIKEMSSKIVNLECFPFRSSNPGFATKEEDSKSRFANKLVSSDSKVSLLSARVIIWKIVEYLSNENKTKPVFIFRRFNQAWYPSIKNVLTKDLKFTSAESERIINIFHNEFFFTMRKKDHKNNSGLDRGLYKDDKKIEPVEKIYEIIGNAIKGET